MVLPFLFGQAPGVLPVQFPNFLVPVLPFPDLSYVTTVVFYLSIFFSILYAKRGLLEFC